MAVLFRTKRNDSIASADDVAIDIGSIPITVSPRQTLSVTCLISALATSLAPYGIEPKQAEEIQEWASSSEGISHRSFTYIYGEGVAGACYISLDGTTQDNHNAVDITGFRITATASVSPQRKVITNHSKKKKFGHTKHWQDVNYYSRGLTTVELDAIMKKLTAKIEESI
jgi:hypothetical protein